MPSPDFICNPLNSQAVIKRAQSGRCAGNFPAPTKRLRGDCQVISDRNLERSVATGDDQGTGAGKINIC